MRTVRSYRSYTSRTLQHTLICLVSIERIGWELYYLNTMSYGPWQPMQTRQLYGTLLAAHSARGVRCSGRMRVQRA